MLLRDRKYWFTDHRAKFEEFLVTHKHHLTHLTHDEGSKMKSAKPIFDYWMVVLNAVANDQDVLAILAKNPDYEHIAKAEEETVQQKSPKISRTASAAVALRCELESFTPCPECGARIYKDAFTLGHGKAASKGGSGHSSNLKPMHPYCNSGHETKRLFLESKRQPAGE